MSKLKQVEDLDGNDVPSPSPKTPNKFGWQGTHPRSNVGGPLLNPHNLNTQPPQRNHNRDKHKKRNHNQHDPEDRHKPQR